MNDKLAIFLMRTPFLENDKRRFKLLGILHTISAGFFTSFHPTSYKLFDTRRRLPKSLFNETHLSEISLGVDFKDGILLKPKTFIHVQSE